MNLKTINMSCRIINFASIGTRDLTEDGKSAIIEVYKKPLLNKKYVIPNYKHW